jgi:hypothetical protein
MNIEHDSDRDFRDDELRTALRVEYAAPAEGSYWAFLERRIMARITSDAAREWWTWFPAWSRAGLAAAALALLVAGVTAWQTRKAQERVAWQELLDTPNEMPVIESAGTDRANRREATLRYLISQ